MKYVFFLLLFWMTGEVFSGGYREFVDAQGRSMRGRVLRFDEMQKKVTIERDNKRVASVPLGSLSEKDQEYIQDWRLSKIFLSNSDFRIDAKRKEKDNDEFSFENTLTKLSSEDTYYEFAFKNRSASRLGKINIKYCIFYEQEIDTHCDQGVYCGELTLDAMAPKSKQLLMTRAVNVYKTELDSDWYYGSGRKNATRGEVHGVWLKASMELSSGELLMRDFQLPDSLSNNKTWTMESVAVGLNRGN